MSAGADIVQIPRPEVLGCQGGLCPEELEELIIIPLRVALDPSVLVSSCSSEERGCSVQDYRSRNVEDHPRANVFHFEYLLLQRIIS